MTHRLTSRHSLLSAAVGVATVKLQNLRKVRHVAGRFLDRCIEARAQKAQLRVNAHLQTFDAERLAQLGLEPAKIREIRHCRSHIPPIF